MEKGLAKPQKKSYFIGVSDYNLIDYLTPVENVKLGGNADA